MSSEEKHNKQTAHKSFRDVPKRVAPRLKAVVKNLGIKPKKK